MVPSSPGATPSSRLAFALDVPDAATARGFVRSLVGPVGVFKVGLELFTAEGPAIVREIVDAGRDCFLDLKLHDIPETVGRAVARCADLGVRYLTIHASGGPAMVERAANVVARTHSSLQILAVTVLTSLDDAAVEAVGWQGNASQAAQHLGALALRAGAHGLVCSPHETSVLRAAHPYALLVTPGIRPAGPSADDQVRVATPSFAIRNGASLLVVGRPIRDAADPLAAAVGIVQEIEAALA